MKSTRQRIIEHLGQRSSATADELGRSMQKTSANIRHHLNHLLVEGAVQVIALRPAQPSSSSSAGRGRPVRVYALASLANQHNLDELASALWVELVSALPGGELPARLEAVAKLLAGDIPPRMGNLTQRLFFTVQRLNAMHYQARWEAHADAPSLILGHCPYAAILPEHPELCQMDAALLAVLSGSMTQQTARLERGTQGGLYCRFSILSRKAVQSSAG